MSLAEDFRNDREALNYCKKYDLESMCPSASPFKIAEALLRAYRDGVKAQENKINDIIKIIKEEKSWETV